ncbi:conserved hypothetical protein [Brevibacillus laterosporus GI-9]|uniref:DUF2515 domain-containing protein n=1 Tax=Brevibacillus laterosporus TaxID=1465 RepID=UPI00024047B9|nr:DUF2515 domain-containing protein [Brevibacillus laterosporus]CCF12647.1 conserved hypothetical protein [Brevibacillus laterosporus GI-9]
MGIRILKKNFDWFKQSQFPPLLKINKELKKRLKEVNKPLMKEAELPEQDQILIRQIKESTRQLNLNNVTRTTAYFDYYRKHPEIHWALLGHMVSRNGGWNMTDLKGELLSKLLSDAEQKDYFLFLERGNWLIFQDVYPQLLLYEESLKRETSLFYLLSFFHVSVFMEVMWDHFWKNGDRYLLAIALVINEQSYLEKRVIQNPYYQKAVLETKEFKVQDLLSLNQILFPCCNNMNKVPGQVPDLIGQTLHHFASLQERILLGKRLYSVLFGSSEILQGVINWAADHPHTGSRKDYWPHLFNDVNESVPSTPRTPYKRRTDDCQLKAGANRLFSPKLQYAWKNIEHGEAEIEDWFEDWQILTYFINQEKNVNGEIYHKYCKTLEKIELAVMAKTAIF